ncbi:MAG: hypothetical protein M3235_07830, partial [Actinomycetota bacterium]|nr:hypothetical protein [Actinomycetota bacterium]
FLYAFWRLCHQQITTEQQPHITHSARVVAAKARVAPDVRVIEVRPRDRAAGDDEPTGWEWQHRWVVRMHKVRQWYPSEQRHRVIYRGPYIKGPADKPFLTGDIVRGLTRRP